MVDSVELQELKPKADKKAKEEKKEKKPKKSTKVDKPQDGDDITDGGAMLFSIDLNPMPIDLAAVPTVAAEEESDDDDEQTGPKKLKPPSGLNRMARRRIKLIERQRDVIRKNMGIPEGSLEKADEVQKKLDVWTDDLNDKAEIRRMWTPKHCYSGINGYGLEKLLI
jgi:hypothetical protein